MAAKTERSHSGDTRILTGMQISEIALNMACSASCDALLLLVARAVSTHGPIVGARESEPMHYSLLAMVCGGLILGGLRIIVWILYFWHLRDEAPMQRVILAEAA